MILQKIKDLFTFGNKNPLKKKLQDKMWEVYRALPTPELKRMFHEYCFLAGGAIRCSYLGEKIKDWDIFFKSKHIASTFVMLLEIHQEDIDFRFKSQHTYTIKVGGEDIQFCLGQYSGDPEDVIAKFDFTNSMAYYDMKEASLCMPEKFLNACDNKLVEFNKNAYNPKIAAQRFNSFTAQGWDFDYLTPMDIVKSMGEKKDTGSFD